MSGPSTAGQGPGATSKAERARQVTEAALDELIAQLEAGNSEKLDAYLAAMSRFHKYSFANVMLILSQRPDATQVAGFHTWRKLGRAVKRGEKGIAIFAPMLIKPREEDGSESDDSPRLRFRVVHVFDISQTEGEPLPELDRASGDPGEALQSLENAVRAAGIELADSEDLGGADGMSEGGKITLRAGMAPAERFSVLVHEWAHELLHKAEDSQRPSRTVRETEAEAVAFIVNRAIGLDVQRASSDYIRLYDGSRDTLVAALDSVQRAACHFIESAWRSPLKCGEIPVSAKSNMEYNGRQR